MMRPRDPTHSCCPHPFSVSSCQVKTPPPPSLPKHTSPYALSMTWATSDLGMHISIFTGSMRWSSSPVSHETSQALDSIKYQPMAEFQSQQISVDSFLCMTVRPSQNLILLAVDCCPGPLRSKSNSAIRANAQQFFQLHRSQASCKRPTVTELQQFPCDKAVSLSIASVPPRPVINPSQLSTPAAMQQDGTIDQMPDLANLEARSSHNTWSMP